MPSLDVFNDDIFGVMSLTAAIETLPFAPSRIGALNLFADKPINTLVAFLEEKDGVLQLFNTAARGSMPYTPRRSDRRVRPFRVPHIPVYDAIMADDVQGIRAFGSESELESVQEHVNDKLEDIKQSMEVTWEWHRIGCIKGTVLDADGSELFDWFDEWGITQQVINFDFYDAGTYDDANPTEDMKMRCLDVKRAMDLALGGVSYKGIHAIVGDDFFNWFVSHPTVRRAYEKFTDGSPFLRQQQMEVSGAYLGFEFGGITWENYRGAIGNTQFVEDDEAHFFPLGVKDLFQRVLAPADFTETVNTRGKPIYVKQERMRFDKGVELHAQSNPLHICTRPKCLIKGVGTNAAPEGSESESESGS